MVSVTVLFHIDCRCDKSKHWYGTASLVFVTLAYERHLQHQYLHPRFFLSVASSGKMCFVCKNNASVLKMDMLYAMAIVFCIVAWCVDHIVRVALFCSGSLVVRVVGGGLRGSPLVLLMLLFTCCSSCVHLFLVAAPFFWNWDCILSCSPFCNTLRNHDMHCVSDGSLSGFLSVVYVAIL